MLAGVVDAGALAPFKCAFPGRKSSGKWVLTYTVKGFGGAHGSRHLYNMMGGNVTDVDFLLMKSMHKEVEALPGMTVLCLPSKEGSNDHNVTLYVPEKESIILNKALDFLPWSSLSLASFENNKR